jgi:hypothetical protein
VTLKVNDKEEIKQIATVSATWETAMGGSIADAMNQVGNGMDPSNSARFRPLWDSDTSADDEPELVRVRTAAKVEPLKEMPLPYSPSYLPKPI